MSGALSEQVATIVTMGIVLKDWQFYVNGAPMPPHEIANPAGVLPAVLWNADKMHRLAYGAPLGVRFRQDREAFMGVRAVVELPPGAPRTPLIMFSMETLYAANEQHPVPQGGASLDHLVRAFFDDSDNNMVPWVVGPSRGMDGPARAE